MNVSSDLSVKPAAIVGDRCGEGAVWCAEEAALYWADINRFLVHRLTWPQCCIRTWQFEEPPTAIALTTERGRLLVALASKLIWWWPSTDRRQNHGFTLEGSPAVRLNDGRADPVGRFWVGSMYNNLAPDGSASDQYMSTDQGALYRVETDGRWTKELSNIGISNTLCWSPRGNQFYFADSMKNCIYIHDYDSASGAIVQTGTLLKNFPAGAPDGSAMDSEGCLWNCRWGGRGIVRVASDGTVIGYYSVPTTNVTTCVFGGHDLRTLFITSARNDDDPGDRLAGTLWAMEAGVSGLPENRVVIKR
jgi:sugar lactone lactonase YvrE